VGLPLALNLLRAGARLVVWRRLPEKCALPRTLGANVGLGARAVYDDVQQRVDQQTAQVH
jgi:3-hydroxyisobutyrate dehydrogenase-like beta-hydroxyacid dehydrogenase